MAWTINGAGMIVDNTQIYITGVLYKQQAFPDNVAEMFNKVDSQLRLLTSLDYEDLCINRAENRFSNSTTREQLLIFLKNVKYNGNSYLSNANCDTLRSSIINILELLSDITYTDIEIRVTREIR